MKGFVKSFFTILISLMLICGITSIGRVAFAQDEEIPEDGVRYTLTYPDGTVVTEIDGNPLTYDDVIEALKEDNWKILLNNQESDADGKVNLPATWKAEGAIKIIETKVPAGYTQGSASELVTDLKEKSATFVNPKEKEEPPITPEEKVKITYNLNGGKYNGSAEDIVEDYVKGTTIIIHDAPERAGYTFDYWKGSEYQPGDKYTATEDHTFTAQWIADKNDPDEPEEPESPIPTTDRKTPGSNPKTGDSNRLGLFILLAIASVAIITLIFIRRKKYISGVITILLVGTFALGSAFAAGGFVINKIDDNDDPVEGAVFDIYGKPEVSWEVLPPETTKVTVRKVWADGDNQDGIRPASVTVNLLADGEKLDSVTVSADDDWKYSFTDLPKYKDGTEIVYTVTEEAVEGYTAEVNGFNIINTHTPEKITVSGTKTWNFGQSFDPEAISYPVKLTVTLQQETSSGWEPVSDKDPFEVEYTSGVKEFSPMAVGEEGDGDRKQMSDEYRWSVPKYDSNHELINYRVVENVTELTGKGFTQQTTSPTRDTDGNIEHNLENKFQATSTDGFNISVRMNYENGPWAKWWGSELGWGGIVKGNQVVTITNNDTNEVKTLTFTPVSGGGISAAQTVQLAAGTYTISQEIYAQEVLDASADEEEYFNDLYLMRTIEQTITIDNFGNCALSTSGSRPDDSFYAQYYWRTLAENPETGDFDIPVFEHGSEPDETGHASGYSSSCVASGSSITLKSIILQGDPELEEM